jgi:hypothetical protein
MPISLNIFSKFDPKGVLNAQSGLDRLGKFATGFGIAAGAAFAAAAAGAVAFGISSLKAADESNRIVRGLDNMIANSEALGKSVQSVEKASKTITDFTQKFALLTGISDETFNSLATSFLAAPNIANMGADGVNRLIQISADAAAATGKDLESVGTALAKALENPETAMAKLQRANIFLTEEQKKTYQSMTDIGDLAGAQAYLIETLGTKYAGAAEAAASPWARLLETFQKLKELVGNELGKALLPIIPQIQAAVDAMIADPAFAVMLAEVAKSFTEMAPSIIELLPSLTELGLVLIPAMIQLIPLLIPLIEFLTGALKFLSDDMARVTENTGEVFLGLLAMIGPFGRLIDGVIQFSKFLGDLGLNLGVVMGPLQALFFFFTDLQNNIKKVTDLFRTMYELITGQRITIPTVLDTQGLRASAGGLRPMAEGGIVTRATNALIGEAGPEAIIPLDRMGKMGGNSYNITVQAGVGDPQVIGQQIVAYIKRYEKASGPVFAGA